VGRVIEKPEVFLKREKVADQNLRGLPSALEVEDVLIRPYPFLTIYATGSYGRREPGYESDLDLFFVDVAPSADEQLGHIHKTLMLGGVIRAARALGFPEFSGDGEWLTVHKLDEFRQFLGTRLDDHHNLFTARMLLLLESECIFGNSSYDRTVAEVLGLYWRDADGKDFLPIFLINDVIRYWKTLCLAYEARRTQYPDDEEKARANLIKLRCSRLWMCFNFLSLVVCKTGESGLSLETAREIVSLKPVDRMLEVARSQPDLEDNVRDVLNAYGWFLGFGIDDAAPKLAEVVRTDDGWKCAQVESSKLGNAFAPLISSLGERSGLSRFITI
jgi:hypothetical protein